MLKIQRTVRGRNAASSPTLNSPFIRRLDVAGGIFQYFFLSFFSFFSYISNMPGIFPKKKKKKHFFASFFCKTLFRFPMHPAALGYISASLPAGMLWTSAAPSPERLAMYAAALLRQ